MKIVIGGYHLGLIMLRHPDSIRSHLPHPGGQGEPRPVGRQHRLGGRALGQVGAEGSIQGMGPGSQESMGFCFQKFRETAGDCEITKVIDIAIKS